MRVIEKLSTMKINDMMKLWRNAVGILADKKRRKMHRDARKVLDAIGIEWERRGEAQVESDEYFNWPSTEAAGGNGQLGTQDWLREGMLNFMGYKVGTTSGLTTTVREKILTEIFAGSLPPAFPRSYLAEWGRASTSQRLRKMAETISALIRNAKRRRDSTMSVAIEHWEQDLKFLHYKFYFEKFHFGWPSIETL